jgi:hypothetical protein
VIYIFFDRLGGKLSGRSNKIKNGDGPQVDAGKINAGGGRETGQ